MLLHEFIMENKFDNATYALMCQKEINLIDELECQVIRSVKRFQLSNQHFAVCIDACLNLCCGKCD